MKYTVVWTPAAEQQMTVAWLSDRDRDELTAAINHCDSTLGDKPHLVGESRTGTLRIAFFGRLTVWFRISHADRQVLIAGIRIR